MECVRSEELMDEAESVNKFQRTCSIKKDSTNLQQPNSQDLIRHILLVSVFHTNYRFLKGHQSKTIPFICKPTLL